MRKRTITHFADTVFWYLLYALPILMWLISAITQPVTPFTTFMSDNLGFLFTDNNPVLIALTQLFGADGILPFFSSYGAIYLVTWFATLLIVHLCVDFVLFIPRLAHKWLNGVTSSEA